MIFFVLLIFFGFQWYWCYLQHTPRHSVSTLCRIFSPTTPAPMMESSAPGLDQEIVSSVWHISSRDACKNSTIQDSIYWPVHHNTLPIRPSVFLLTSSGIFLLSFFHLASLCQGKCLWDEFLESLMRSNNSSWRFFARRSRKEMLYITPYSLTSSPD